MPQPPARTPRWVYVAGAITLVVVVFVLLSLTGVLGGHGPGHH